MGNAVVAVDEVTFHAMAANLFNDVIGDICGIISGSTAIAIVLSIKNGFGIKSVLLFIAMSEFVAALTVGGKAIGKSFAIARARYIVYYVGIVIYYMKRVFGRLKSNKKS